MHGLTGALGVQSYSMSKPVPFLSECPSCGQERLLTGYEPDELTELLAAGAEIEGYCSSCDERWPISTEERADLSLALNPRRGA